MSTLTSEQSSRLERRLSLPPGGDEGVDGDEAGPLATGGVEHEGLPVERAAARLQREGEEGCSEPAL